VVDSCNNIKFYSSKRHSSILWLIPSCNNITSNSSKRHSSILWLVLATSVKASNATAVRQHLVNFYNNKRSAMPGLFLETTDYYEGNKFDLFNSKTIILATSVRFSHATAALQR
jgi:hypothetical protein